MRRLSRASSSRPVVWLLAALWLGGSAGAHGEANSDLRGVTLCLDPQTVQLDLEALPPSRAEQARPLLEAALTQRLNTALDQDRVNFERRPSCAGQVGHTQLRASVRYLDPRSYIGYGQDTYSYTVLLRVNAAGATVNNQKRGFSSGWAELYSEAQRRRPFEAVVTEWGEEQARDLTALWRRDNPTLTERLTQAGPLRWGLLVGTLAVMLVAVSFLLSFRRKKKPSIS